MLASSAPIFEPSLPAQMRPVISGPSDLTTAWETIEGSHDSAPNDARDGRDCFVKTIPARNDVNAIKNNDLFPTRKHCLRISFISKGGANAFLKNRMVNL